MSVLKGHCVNMLVAVLATVLILWPFSSFFWCMNLSGAPTQESQGHPTYTSAPQTKIAIHSWQEWGLEDPASFVETGFATAICLLFFALISLFRKSHLRRDETLCRKCRAVLRELTNPACPRCGEQI